MITVAPPRACFVSACFMDSLMVYCAYIPVHVNSSALTDKINFINVLEIKKLFELIIF